MLSGRVAGAVVWWAGRRRACHSSRLVAWKSEANIRPTRRPSLPCGQISSTGSARSTTTPPSETCSGWGLGLGSCQPGRRVAGLWQTRSAKRSGQRPLRLQWPHAARLPGHKLAPTPSTTAADAHGHLVSAEQPSQCRVVARALDGQLARHWLRVEEPVGVELGDARVHVHLQCGTEARVTVVAAR